MRPAEHDAARLQRHMAGTYLNLRAGIGIIGAALPVVLLFGGWLLDGDSLRGSMSAYYYSPAMRDTFVGGLISIGVFLYLYKGFSTAENVALNLAGAFAVGVAMFPTGDASAQGSPLHPVFAVLFFLAIGYVCVFRASDTLSLIRNTERARRLQRTYRTLGVVMVLSPLLAIAFSYMLPPAGERPLIFFIEAFGVWSFATYWLMKSLELKETGAERLALDGKVQAAVPYEGETAAPGRLVQVEPDDEEATAMVPA